MIRCTIEMIPGGDESKAYPLGLIEIANTGQGDIDGKMDYRVKLTKTAPFRGALKERWKGGAFVDDDEGIIAGIPGFNRRTRGVYDLLFRALDACGLAARNPEVPR